MTDGMIQKQRSGVGGSLIRILQVVLYIPIQIAFIPFAIVGIMIAVYKEHRVVRKLGVSYSAVQALQYRWIMHHFGTRPDPLSVAFIKHFPCESHFGMWTTLGALVLARRWLGLETMFSKIPEPGEETLVSCAGVRVLMFDRILADYVDMVDQVVLPGVGFDLMALHLTNGKPVAVFEVDQANTLNVKTNTLKKAGIPHDWITFVPVDYATESWVEKLKAAGFDPTKKTLFIWQSVSLYLEADTVKATLKEMAELCVAGSVVAQDLYSRAFVSGEISALARKNQRLIAKMGEPWLFGIDMAGDPKKAVASFLDDCGLDMTSCVQFGEKLGLEPYYCIVEARKS